MQISHRIKRLAMVFALSTSATFLLSGCVTAVVGATALGAGTVIGSESRTVDVQVQDKKIQYEMLKILNNDKDRSKYEVFRVDAVSVNGNVLVIGQTKDLDYLNTCLQKIKHVEGIKRIFNQVTYGDPISTGQQATDSFTTAKVKSALLFGSKISSGRFKVITENGVVYLLGYVTKEEGERAINQTRKVDGVKRIHPIYDYMDVSGTPNSTDGAPIEDGTGALGSASGSSVSAVSSTPASSAAIETQNTVDNGGAVLVDDEDLLAPSAPAAQL